MGEPSDTGKVRKDVRAAIAIPARYRCVGDDQWQRGVVHDLSIAGALLSCTSPIPAGQRIDLRLQRSNGTLDLELVAAVQRNVERSDGPAIGVRFLQLTPEVAGYVAEALNDAVADAEDVAAPPGEPTPEATGQNPQALGAAQLSVIRLHERSIYELLGLEPSCSDGELESRAEALIDSVARVLTEARGRRYDRLRVLSNSLDRLRPLWTDALKRTRYDLRWGYIRATERWRAAAEGTGVHVHVLSAIWIDLYPERVREAVAILRAAPKRGDGRRQALLEAIALEPFARRQRELLKELLKEEGVTDVESPTAAVPRPEVTQRGFRFVTADIDDASLPMPSPSSESPSLRGNVADLPIRGLLYSLAADASDAEIEVRVGGRTVGLVGTSEGDVVIAHFGDKRGPSAVQALLALREGTFVVRYGAPRDELRHMRTGVTELLDSNAR